MSKKRQAKKLSAQLPTASLTATSHRLQALARVTEQSRVISKDLEQLAACLRTVAADKGEPFRFTPILADNEQLFRSTFVNCDDVQFRQLTISDTRGLVIYLEGMVDEAQLQSGVLEPLLLPAATTRVPDINTIANQILTAGSVSIVTSSAHAIAQILGGNALLLLDGSAEALLIGVAKPVKRNIDEAKAEGIIRGPHDAFNETLIDNIVLLRRRTHDSNFKVLKMTVGLRTKTTVAIVYIANLVKPGLIAELQRRLTAKQVDRLLVSNLIEELIIDHPWSPFPQTHVTEWPAKVMAALYEGRAALLVDNTPNCIIVPCTITSLMQTIEDYTTQSVVASLIRITRYVAAFVAIFLPAVYVAIVSYHPGMLPTSLAISIAQLRAGTPFPSLLEVLLMEVLLEIFQEAVIRLPTKISAAAGVVGALVIGTTVVQAGLVNPLLVVVMATTAIASYNMVSYNLSIALRFLRVPVLIAAAMLGLFGAVLAAMALLIHLCSLRSFGESYLGGTFNTALFSDWKDQLIRLPGPFMTTRPTEYGPQDKKRMR